MPLPREAVTSATTQDGTGSLRRDSPPGVTYRQWCFGGCGTLLYELIVVVLTTVVVFDVLNEFAPVLTMLFDNAPSSDAAPSPRRSLPDTALTVLPLNTLRPFRLPLAILLPLSETDTRLVDGDG